jgi:hypothetical protein
VSKLLGSAFEEELIFAVAVESGSALAKIYSKDGERLDSQTNLMTSSSSSSLSNYVLSDVDGWKDAVLEIDRWVASESQQMTLLANIDKNKERDFSQSYKCTEHIDDFNQRSSVIATDDTNMQFPMTIHVIDRFNYRTDRKHERPQIANIAPLNITDHIVQPGLLNISENFPVAYDNHIRLREMLGSPLSSTLSSTPQHSDFMNNGAALSPLKSQSSNRDVDVEKKSTPTRVIDVRDTNKLAELLRGVKSR